MFRIIFATLFILISTSTIAEQKQDFSNLEVHYIALPSTFIEPYIATQYGLKRSKYTGLVNISVLDKNQRLLPIEATLMGVGENRIGQTEKLPFKKITEGKSIYYTAPYPLPTKR